MKILVLFLLVTFNLSHATTEEAALVELNRFIAKAESLLDNDLKGFKKKKAVKYSKRALELAKKDYSPETKSKAYFASGAFQGIIAKGIFAIWRIKTVAKHTSKAFSRLKKAIELDNQNEAAIITHARLTRSGYKHRSIVNKFIQPKINFGQEKQDALNNLNGLQDQSNPKIAKYRRKLEKL